MTYQIEAVGNLGGNPEMKTVNIGDEEKPVVNLRVYFDRRVSDGNGGFVDKGGFWRDVAIWKPALGDRAMTHLRKGARIIVRGTEQVRAWKDQEGQERESYTVNADYVALDLLGIETVKFTKRRRGAESSDDDGGGSDVKSDDDSVAEAAD